jgi:hypothetical protein
LQSQGGNTGTVNSLSLMDYSAGPVIETKSTQTNAKINSNSKTLVNVTTDVTGVNQKKRRQSDDYPVHVRRNGNAFQIRGPWNAGTAIALLALNGEVEATVTPTRDGEWIYLPRGLSVGNHLVRFVRENGARETRSVVLH